MFVYDLTLSGNDLLAVVVELLPLVPQTEHLPSLSLRKSQGFMVSQLSFSVSVLGFLFCVSGESLGYMCKNHITLSF